VGLVWGDARIANQIFDDFRCVAVLDWEMASLGDPIQDLAWYCFFDRLFADGLGQARLPGIPSRDATAARYEDLTGRAPRNLDYYEVFAAFRFAVILQRVAGLMIAAGGLPADTDFATNNFATAMLTALIGAPVDR
jgi:aminoglycoside phosphotransferase (APT) family kinase protein